MKSTICYETYREIGSLQHDMRSRPSYEDQKWSNLQDPREATRHMMGKSTATKSRRLQRPDLIQEAAVAGDMWSDRSTRSDPQWQVHSDQIQEAGHSYKARSTKARSIVARSMKPWWPNPRRPDSSTKLDLWWPEPQ